MVFSLRRIKQAAFFQESRLRQTLDISSRSSSDVTNFSVDVPTPPSFRPFQRLPLELRLKIWNLNLPEKQRCLCIRATEAGLTIDGAKPPTNVSVCWEAREETFTRYKPAKVHLNATEMTFYIDTTNDVFIQPFYRDGQECGRSSHRFGIEFLKALSEQGLTFRQLAVRWTCAFPDFRAHFAAMLEAGHFKELLVYPDQNCRSVGDGEILGFKDVDLEEWNEFVARLYGSHVHRDRYGYGAASIERLFDEIRGKNPSWQAPCLRRSLALQ